MFDFLKDRKGRANKLYEEDMGKSLKEKILEIIGQQYQDLLESLISSKCVQRLKNLRQFGLRYSTHDVRAALEKRYQQRLPIEKKVSQAQEWAKGVTKFDWYSHTRYLHSIGTSYLNIQIAQRINQNQKDRIPEKKMVEMTIAGLLHDIGHPALCHAGEVVIRKLKQQTHEERTKQLIEKDAEIKEILTKHSIDTCALFQILDEKGLGQILSLADTLSYLELDAIEIGIQNPPAIFSNLEGILDFHYPSGKIIVSLEGRRQIEELLTFRKFMYGQVYSHLFSLITEAMAAKALIWCINNGKMRLEELIEGTDKGIYEKLQEIALGDPPLRALINCFELTSEETGLYELLPYSIDLQKLPKSVSEKEIETKIASALNIDDRYVVVIFTPKLKDKRISLIVKENKKLTEQTVSGSDITTPWENQLLVTVAPNIYQIFLDKIISTLH